VESGGEMGAQVGDGVEDDGVEDEINVGVEMM
jgi:hypothetical protein